MQLLDKFKEQFAHLLSNKALLPLLENVEIVDVDTDNLNSVGNDIDPKKTIFVGHKTSPKEALSHLLKFDIEHFVQIDRDDFFYDLFAACVMLKKPASFINNPLPFFIKNFNPIESMSPIRSTTLTFSSSAEKSPILHSIQQFLQEHQKTSNFMDAIHVIADELIMNATYNAPVDGDGKHIYMNKDRSEVVDLPEDKAAKIFVTHDERRLLIGCEDPYGSVNRFKMLSQLAKVHKDSQSSPNEGTGGAGLGSKMMIDYSCGFYVVVKKNQKTLVCCSLPLGVSFRKAEKFSKNLHFTFF